MIQIDDTLVSLDVIEKEFRCDISQCRGECCIEGDSGAPLEEEEVQILEEILPVIRNNIPEKSKAVINRQGVSYIDEEGDRVTSIVDGRECVFAYTDEKGICKCTIEKAYREGKIPFYKPISCHLYPIRIDKYDTFQAVNYHKWDVCECAKILGKKQNLKIYEFLKEPLIRRFGEAWYNELDAVAKEWNKQKKE